MESSFHCSFSKSHPVGLWQHAWSSLKTAAASALGKARVEFGPGDLTASPQIAVLPPRAGPHETHSLALPTYFDLAIEKETCLIVRRDTGEVFAVPDVTCKPLAD